MDEGGDDTGHVHPFVAQQRLEMKARLQKRLRKLQKLDSEKVPLLDSVGSLNLGDDPPSTSNVQPPGGRDPGEEISALAEAVK